MRDRQKTEARYWIPYPAIAAAIVLIVLALFAVSLGYLGSNYDRSLQALAGGQTGEATAVQPVVTATEAPSEDDIAAGTPEQQALAARLKDMQAQLDAQNAAIDQREKDMAERERTLSELVSAKASIIQELSEKFDSMGLAVDIDKITGSVRFSQAVLFGYNEASISTQGKGTLDKFFPAYMEVLMSDKNKKLIDEIVIEGHADDGGTFQYNLELSQNRAFSVSDYLITNKYLQLADGSDVKRLIATAGRSFSKPVLVNGETDKEKSRRVEFIFRLVNEELLSQARQSGGGQ
ncbi:MAG: OmpA family protein [Clostridiales bacterium]|nr:OmpA family protein [Clostridiales bacterium]